MWAPARLLRDRIKPAARAETERSASPLAVPRLEGGLRPIAIKLPAPAARRSEWGDSHFADALARAFCALGQPARVDVHEDWARHEAEDELSLVLRGLHPYTPRPGETALMWMISHPEAPDRAELSRYQHIFVASEGHAATLAADGLPASALLQCTDPARFYPCPDPAEARPLLFVGNSRRQLRPIVRDAIAIGAPLTVFGAGWEFLPRRYWAGEHIDNAELSRAYASTGVLLNDHWPKMRKLGFISNRLFDASAAGAIVISDPVKGLREVFGDGIYTYEDRADLAALLRRLAAEPEAARARALALSEQVRQEHSFLARAQAILELLAERSLL